MKSPKNLRNITVLMVESSFNLLLIDLSGMKDVETWIWKNLGIVKHGQFKFPATFPLQPGDLTWFAGKKN